MLDRKKLLGQRIKEFRDRKKLTQDKLAEMVGIDPKHLSRIENGRNYPSMETLEKLVTNLSITFEDIFEFNHLDSREIILDNTISILKNLPDDKLKFIYKMLREL